MVEIHIANTYKRRIKNSLVKNRTEVPGVVSLWLIWLYSLDCSCKIKHQNVRGLSQTSTQHHTTTGAIYIYPEPGCSCTDLNNHNL